MPETISRDDLVNTLLRLGYEVLAEEGGFIMVIDPEVPVRPLKFDFSQGPNPWDDLREQLEYEGVDPSRFLAELDSLG